MTSHFQYHFLVEESWFSTEVVKALQVSVASQSGWGNSGIITVFQHQQEKLMLIYFLKRQSFTQLGLATGRRVQDIKKKQDTMFKLLKCAYEIIRNVTVLIAKQQVI